MLTIVINIINLLIMIFAIFNYVKISFYERQDIYFQNIYDFLKEKSQNTNTAYVLQLLIAFNLNKISLELLKKSINKKKFSDSSFRKESQYAIYHWIIKHSKNNKNLSQKLHRLNYMNLILTIFPIIFFVLSFPSTLGQLFFIVFSFAFLVYVFFQNLMIIIHLKKIDYEYYMKSIPLLYLQFIGSKYDKNIYNRLNSLATSFRLKDKQLFIERVTEYLEIISLHILSSTKEDFDVITTKFLNYIDDIPDSIQNQVSKDKNAIKPNTELTDEFILNLKKIKDASY